MRNKKFYPWVVVGLLWVVALLNYMDAEALKSILVNGEQFDGYFPNGTATTLVIETKRPIGF